MDTVRARSVSSRIVEWLQNHPTGHEFVSFDIMEDLNKPENRLPNDLVAQRQNVESFLNANPTKFGMVKSIGLAANDPRSTSVTRYRLVDNTLKVPFNLFTAAYTRPRLYDAKKAAQERRASERERKQRQREAARRTDVDAIARVLEEPAKAPRKPQEAPEAPQALNLAEWIDGASVSFLNRMKALYDQFGLDLRLVPTSILLAELMRRTQR